MVLILVNKQFTTPDIIILKKEKRKKFFNNKYHIPKQMKS